MKTKKIAKHSEDCLSEGNTGLIGPCDCGVEENASLNEVKAGERSEHTPTPWYVGYYGSNEGKIYIGPRSHVSGIAEVRDATRPKEVSEANAEFIVRAANSYEALLAFAKAVMPTVKKNLPDFSLIGERVIAEAEGK